jgi:anti-sigma regulatory factor (Ser/Thr protein kinase)
MEFNLQLTCDAAAPGHARRAVAERFATHPRVDDLLVCVSEVVSNAVKHTQSAAEMRVSQRGETVRVEVLDADAHRPPALGEPDPLAPSGRGLRILDHLAARWGSHPAGDGKAVWFELDP